MERTESPTVLQFGRSLIPPLIDCWRGIAIVDRVRGGSGELD
ncbi:hypothetical protein [Pedosphaera parvula]|nr:hypothetical protein [Pedosphaera parvula]